MYVAGNVKLGVYNLQPDPLHPALVGQVSTPSTSLEANYRIAVNGTTAIVQVIQSGNNVVRLVMCRTPRAPWCGRVHRSPARQGRRHPGHLAFVADWLPSGGLQPYSGADPYWARLKGLAILDVTDLDNPILVGTYNTDHSSIRDVRVAGNRVYVFCDGQGLEVLDITDPTSPTRVGGYFSSAGMRHVCKVDNFLYISDVRNGFLILDVTNSAAPHCWASTTGR